MAILIKFEDRPHLSTRIGVLTASIAKSGIQPPRSIGSYVHSPAEQIEQRGARANIVVPAGHMRPRRPFRALAIAPRVAVAPVISLMSSASAVWRAHRSSSRYSPTVSGHRSEVSLSRSRLPSVLFAPRSPLTAPRSRVTPVHGDGSRCPVRGARCGGRSFDAQAHQKLLIWRFCARHKAVS
jgi:hypothetical protein